nr:immunoglobulin heavy chain junction region [Macaca mulatta]MOW27009.1 immunoglobulin heavy chain junction region [Macaca mulatta]
CTMMVISATAYDSGYYRWW